LALLQNADELPGTELAYQLEVDSRTLRRCIIKLQDMGVPVQSVRGRYGAFRLLPASKLPALMLTNQEAVTVSVGLRVMPPKNATGCACATSRQSRRDSA